MRAIVSCFSSGPQKDILLNIGANTFILSAADLREALLSSQNDTSFIIALVTRWAQLLSFAVSACVFTATSGAWEKRTPSGQRQTVETSLTRPNMLSLQAFPSRAAEIEIERRHFRTIQERRMVVQDLDKLVPHLRIQSSASRKMSVHIAQMGVR